MGNYSQPIRCAATGAIFLTLLSYVSAAAGTFGVTTRIFEQASVDPAAEHRILFDEGLVFDLPQIHARYVTVYDPSQDRVTLLDRQRQVKTEIRIEDLVKITAQARAAADTDQQRTRLGINCKVQASDQVPGYSVRFGNIEYHTTIQKPDDPSMAVDYGRFAILASRLNLVRRLGPPPFARMTLSEHLAARREIPLETTLSLKLGETTHRYRSTHELDELSAEDRQRITEVRGMMTLYRAIDFKDFPTE